MTNHPTQRGSTDAIRSASRSDDRMERAFAKNDDAVEVARPRTTPDTVLPRLGVTAPLAPRTLAAIPSSFAENGDRTAGVDNWSARPSRHRPRPVVLINGAVGGAADRWTSAASMFVDAGYLVYHMRYGEVAGNAEVRGLVSVRESAKQLSDFVDLVRAATGAGDVDIVSHSIGGVIARYYLKFLGGAARVHHLVALAPPNHGTTEQGVARLAEQVPDGRDLLSSGVSPAYQEVLVGSPLLARLNCGSETEPDVRYTVIATEYDDVVTPYTSCWLKGDNVRNVLLQDLNRSDLSEHGRIASDPFALREVIRTLDSADLSPMPTAGSIRRKRLTGLDLAFVHLEGAGVPMNVGALAIFEPEGALDVLDLIATLSTRIGTQRRFAMRLTALKRVPGVTEWTEDRDFQPEDHIRVCPVPSPGLVDQAAHYVGHAMERKLDHARPPWELHVLTGLSDGRFGIMLKMHRALAAGTTAARLAVSLLDQAVAIVGVEARQDVPELWPAPAGWPGTSVALITRAAIRLARSGHRAARLSDAVVSILRHVRPPWQASLALPGRSSTRRRLTLVNLDPEVLHTIGVNTGATTYEVVIGTLAGALRDWLGHRSPDLTANTMRALVLFQGTGPGRPEGDAAYLCDLPVAEPEPLERLNVVRATMNDGRCIDRGPWPDRLADLAEFMPASVQLVTMPLAGRSANVLYDLMITYVRLPDQELTVTGARLQETFPAVPLPKGQPLNITVAEYRGSVDITLCRDPVMVPDIAVLAGAVRRAMAALEVSVTATVRVS